VPQEYALDGSEDPLFKRILRNEDGLSVITVVSVILVLSGLGYTLTDMMAAKLNSVYTSLDAARAFYLAESGIQYAGKYLKRVDDWSTVANVNKNMGGGSFGVTFSNYASGSPESIQAASIGSYGIGQREIKVTFER
jgi:hypothetical protein